MTAIKDLPEDVRVTKAVAFVGNLKGPANVAAEKYAVDVSLVTAELERLRNGSSMTDDEIADAAIEGIKLDDKPEPYLPAPSAPMAVARVLEQQHRTEGRLTLRHWRGAWMRWDRCRWIEDEERAVKSWAYRQLEHAKYLDETGKGDPVKDWNPNRRRIGDLLDALQGTTLLAETIDAPAWLDRAKDDAPAAEIVACTNGLLHVGTRKLLDLTPRFFNLVSVPFDYDPAAAKPTEWLAFLAKTWPDDPESIQALQEFIGYVLSGRTDLHKILMLIGPTRSGKGTIARILAALVGKGNAAGPTLASLGTNFGLSPLLGKPLALVSDARLGGTNVSAVVERLLSISGEDMLTVDRKYREPWTGKLPTRFVVLSNELPRFGDASGAIANRFIVLQQTQSWLGKEDPKLTGKLLAELPGILLWALDGLDRLTTNRTFTAPKSSEDAISALQDLVSPMSAFVRDECEVKHGHEVAVATLFAAWKDWCEENGRDRAGTVQSFGRDLLAVVPGLRSVRPNLGEGVRERRYVGIRLNAAHSEPGRGPSRTEDQKPDPVRDGPRTNSLLAASELCTVCRTWLDPVNVLAGHTTHPDCDGAA